MKQVIKHSPYIVCLLLVFTGFFIGISTNTIVLLSYKTNSLTDWIISISTIFIMIGTLWLSFLAHKARKSWIEQKNIENGSEIISKMITYFMVVDHYAGVAIEIAKVNKDIRAKQVKLKSIKDRNKINILTVDIEADSKYLSKLSDENYERGNEIASVRDSLLASASASLTSRKEILELIYKVIDLDGSSAHKDWPRFYRTFNLLNIKLQGLLRPCDHTLDLPKKYKK